MSTDQSCAVRVDAEFHSRYDDLQQLWEAYCEDPENQVEDLGTLDEYGLSFDYVAPHTFKDQERGYFRYQLSWGGPSDEFRIYAEGREYTWHVDKIEYWFLDWFDGAKRVLTGEHFRFMAELFDSFFVQAGCAESEYNEAMEDYEEPDESDDETGEDDE